MNNHNLVRENNFIKLQQEAKDLGARSLEGGFYPPNPLASLPLG